MSTNQILPVNNNINSSGQGAKANGIVQIQQPNQNGAWVLCDDGQIFMNGTIIPSGPGLDHISSQDNSCSVNCNNAGNLQIQSNNNVSFTVDNQTTINTNTLLVNGNIYSMTLIDGQQIQSDGGASSILFSTPELKLQADNQINIKSSAGITIQDFGQTSINLIVTDGNISTQSDIMNLNVDDNLTINTFAYSQNCNNCDIQSQGGITLQDNAEGTINIFVNNGVINTQCDVMYLTGDDSVTVNTNTFQANCSTAGIQANDSVLIQGQNQVTIESNAGNVNIVAPTLFNINTYPSSQYYMVYGQSKGEAAMIEQYHIPFPDPDSSQPDFNLRMFGYPDFNEWFANDQYNPCDNNFIQSSGNNFRFVCPNNTMVQITITFQLRYSYDRGTYPSTYLCCGLYNVDQGAIVAQSINWQELNDVKFKWVTFKTTFTMRTNDQLYFPFFQNQNHDQLSDTETGGLQRSSIKFKFYQFITY